MLKILIAGNGKKDKFTTSLLNTFKIRDIKYMYISSSCIEINPSFGDEKSFLIVESSLKQEIKDFEADILVIKNDEFSRSTDISSTVKKNECYLFFEPQNCELKDFIKELNLKPITCGINEKNTITLASLDVDRITVSIQREIVGIKNNKIEPQDYSVSISQNEKDAFPLIIAAGIIALNE